MAMTKREALERCMAQWQQIQIELYKMEVAAIDGELDVVPPFSLIKRKALQIMGIPVEDYPISLCYLCEYTLVDGVSDCLVCPLKGYAWEQCETDGPYLACENAYDDGWYDDAADYAQEILDACDRALEDLDDEE